MLDDTVSCRSSLPAPTMLALLSAGANWTGTQATSGSCQAVLDSLLESEEQRGRILLDRLACRTLSVVSAPAAHCCIAAAGWKDSHCEDTSGPDGRAGPLPFPRVALPSALRATPEELQPASHPGRARPQQVLCVNPEHFTR